MLKRVETSFPAVLRERLAVGRPAEARVAGWRDLEDAIISDPEALTAALEESARMSPGRGSVTVAPRSAIGCAVANANGDIIQSDAMFQRWFGPEPDQQAIRRLVRLAQKGGAVSGLVEAANGAAIAACAGGADIAAGWPLSADCRNALDGPGRRIVLLCFAPSRDTDLAARASEAFGLTPLEARLAEALLDAPNLEAAAQRIGVGRETAREALKKAMQKAGARRSPDLVRRMMDLMCGDHPTAPSIEGVLASSFGATAAEAKAAAGFARGLTAREVAEGLGVKEATVRGQLKAVFAKTGVNKAKDLVRLAAETSTLAALAGAAETVFELSDPNGRLRVIASGDRRIALTDYGPRSGKPVIVMHGAATGRRLPPEFVRALQSRGYRPIVPQRPGFGLTDVSRGDYLQDGADDMARIMDALKIDRAKLLVRDSSTPTGLRFAADHPGRVIAGIAINPKWPASEQATVMAKGGLSLMGTISRSFITSPHLIGLVAETLRRQTRTDLLESTVRSSLASLPCDAEALKQPGVLDALVRDAQGMFARTSLGFTSEQRAYVAGWTLPADVGGDRWIVAECEGLALAGIERVWGGLPKVSFRPIVGAGFLVYVTHPQAVADLVADA
ncbi:MAG: alpha/beta fold hydrolase [Pseudomonadota bacterium]